MSMSYRGQVGTVARNVDERCIVEMLLNRIGERWGIQNCPALIILCERVVNCVLNYSHTQHFITDRPRLYGFYRLTGAESIQQLSLFPFHMAVLWPDNNRNMSHRQTQQAQRKRQYKLKGRKDSRAGKVPSHFRL